MTDNRIEKTRVKIEKAYNEAQKRVKLVKDVYWEGKVDAYRNVLCVFDSLQEEPIYTDFTKALAECIHQAQGNVVDPMVLAETWKDELIKLAKSEEPVSEIDFEQELYKAFGHVKDFTLCLKIARRFYEMGRNYQEPVSEEFGEASKEWLNPKLDKSYANYGEAKMMELTHFDGYAMLDAIEFGAEWQKTKDESTTEDLGDYINELSKQFPEVSFAKLSRIAVRVAKWQREHLWKPADGDDLPEIDREVIALLDNGKVVFAHRPPEYWDGKNIDTGDVTRYYPKTYDKGGWNIPNVKYWLDCLIPKEIEL